MTEIARCGIYETRPEVCRAYPTVYHYMPNECTYTFPEGGLGARHGDCSCGAGACCAIPREGGEPGGTPLPEEAGGQPCKHLVWEHVDHEKIASYSQGDDGLGTKFALAILGQDVF